MFAQPPLLLRHFMAYSSESQLGMPSSSRATRYTTLEDALGASIGKAIEDPVANDAAQQELTLMLESPEVTSTAAQEIASLTQTVRDIRARYRNIQIGLSKVGQLGPGSAHMGRNHARLSSDWDRLLIVSKRHLLLAFQCLLAEPRG